MKQTIGNHLHRNNPFYLLSAVSMLVGCLAQSKALGITNFYWLQRDFTGERGFAWAALLSLGGAASGSSPTGIFSNWSRIVPETAGELGSLGIVAAFALLGVGFAFSLWRPSPPLDAPPSAPLARRDPPRRPTRVY